MSISEPFIRRPVATSLLALSVLLIGALAYFNLQVAPLPQVDFPTISITANLSGASAETMATSVATPLERALSQVPQVTSMTSSSSLGKTQIVLQFDLARNIDGAAQDVESAIASAARSLPKTMTAPPSYHKVNPALQTLLSLALTSPTRPLTELDRLAENFLAQKLSLVPGVGLVDYHGQQRPAVRIQVDPDRIAARGLTLADVRSIVGLSTISGPKGNIAGTTSSVALNANDQLTGRADFANMVVAYKSGAPIRLSDLGQVIDGPEDINQVAAVQGAPAIIVDVHQQAGFNVVQTTQTIMDNLAAMTAALPADTHVQVVGDRTQTITASVKDVQFTLLMSIALVVIVILGFLRNITSTVIASITIPLSLLGTFAVMYLLGYTLDNLSIMGLSIAVGFVVDDAIVVIENIARHREQGKSVMAAAIDGTKEVGFTIVAMTISLIAVFIPILLMGGMVGRLFREFAVTVSVAIFISGVVSLTVAPMLSARLGKGGQAGLHASQNRFIQWTERFFDRVQHGYARRLDWALDHQRTMIVTLLATIVATAGLYVYIPKGFFPQQDTGMISATVEGAADISLSAMRERMATVGATLQTDPDVQTVYYWIGPNPTLSQGKMMIMLKPFADRTATAAQVIARLGKRAAAISGIKLSQRVVQDIQIGGRLSKGEYQYTLQGPDNQQLDHWSGVLLGKLKASNAIRDLTTDRQASATQATLKVNRDMASRLGVTMQAVDDALYDAFGQRQVATLLTQLDQYSVILEVDPKWQLSTESLKHLYVHSTLSTDLVPLSVVSTLERGVSPVTINHQGLFPAITLSFNLAPGAALGDAVTQIQAATTSVRLPETINGSFQGTAQTFQDSLRTQPYLLLAAVLAVYVVLGVLYENPVHPLTIISTLPSAGLGALIALLITGEGLTVLGMIGIILLIGIVKKNAIMMVDFALQAENDRLSSIDAIRRGCILRFRPIMMTTLAALLGALPLALGQGAGAELRRPLGIAIVGGLLLSQVLTLYTTPVVYLWFEKLMQRWRTWRANRPSQHAEPEMLPAHQGIS